MHRERSCCTFFLLHYFSNIATFNISFSVSTLRNFLYYTNAACTNLVHQRCLRPSLASPSLKMTKNRSERRRNIEANFAGRLTRSRRLSIPRAPTISENLNFPRGAEYQSLYLFHESASLHAAHSGPQGTPAKARPAGKTWEAALVSWGQEIRESNWFLVAQVRGVL